MPYTANAFFRLSASIVEMIPGRGLDRKSTRLNSSHDQISYAVFCLKKKKTQRHFPSVRTSTRPHSKNKQSAESPTSQSRHHDCMRILHQLTHTTRLTHTPYPLVPR